MGLVVHNDELAAWPRLVEPPRGPQRAAHVEAPADQPSTHGRQTVGGGDSGGGHRRELPDDGGIVKQSRRATNLPYLTVTTLTP
jgi:hypothetical protein